MLFAIFTAFQTAAMAEANEQEMRQRGRNIYEKSCQVCHGQQGEGVQDRHAEPLVGDMSVGGLADLIAKTMPEEDPEACVGEDANAVASFIHHEFYSEAARIRNRPPRISLARLTGEQLRQSMADLYGHFQGQASLEDRRGVDAKYYAANRGANDKLKLERIDQVIDFDFGEKSPAEGIEPEEFYINWQGSLKVDQSGRYEIILRSTCSCMLKFGANDRELVNNHVQSEGKEEFRRTLQLTAGREYPFSLEFIQRKRKTKQPAAKVSLSWIPPNGVEEIIPHQHLLPSRMPATFSLQTKLPPDDRSYGYERGIAINPQWDESTTAAAIEFAEIAASELFPRYRRDHRDDPNENRQVLRGFLSEVVQTAFRGPLDEETRRRYIDDQLNLAEDDSEAIMRSLLISLKSPRFLYPLLDGDRTRSQRVANRLALILYDSLPSDRWLLQEVEKDRLTDEVAIQQAATKMISDYRSRAKVRAFLYQWLGLADLAELSKDPKTFPEFDSNLVRDLRASLDMFLESVAWNEPSDFRQLLQADWAITTERLEAFYGPAWKANDPDATGPSRSVSDPRVHAGILTHPLLLSHFAYSKTSSPIHRGVHLTRHTLGRVLRPPNEAFTPINPELHPELTTRQRVELQTGEVSCQVCHKKINSLGFALEAFDAAGRFREQERNQPIDATGYYVARSGETAQFDGARQLADFLASSEDCHRAFVEAAFEHLVKQPIAAFGPDVSDQLTKSFRDSGFQIQQLLISIVQIAAVPPPPTQNT